jgi:hypothetical protein
VAGASKDKVAELFWDTFTQVRAESASVPRNSFCFVCTTGMKSAWRLDFAALGAP